MKLSHITEAKLAKSSLLERYDAFADSAFVKDTEGTSLSSNVAVGHFTVFVDIDESLTGAYTFDTNHHFDHELTSYVSCPKCNSKKGVRCKGYSGRHSTLPHRDRFNKTSDLMNEEKISSKDSQLAVSFVRSVMRKNNLPYEELVPGYEADQFLVKVTHEQLGLSSAL